MSDPPEAGISSYNPPAKEFSSPITNGQSNTPNSTGAAHQGIGAGGKCIGEIDAARPLSSHSPNVTQVIKQPPRPMEATNPALPVGPQENAQVKTIQSNQSFPSQRVQGGQLSPSNMQVNSQLSASPQVRPSSSSPHQNAGLQSEMELKTSVTGLAASNGPPAPSLDVAHTSSMPMQPSTSTPIKNQYSNVPGSSSPVPGPVSQSASVPTASPAAPHGSLYPSPPNSIPSQLSPGQQASPAGLKPQPAPSNIPLGSAPALIPAQSSSGPFPAQSSGDQAVNNQPSSGPVPSQSLAGPMPPQPMAGSGPFPSSHSMGGPIPPQSSGGPNPPQLSGAPFPSQSSAAPFPPQPPGGPFPPQQKSGQYPPQSSAGPFSMQPSAGQYPSQSLSGPLPPQLSTRSFPTMTPGGQFPPRPPAGPYYGPQGSGPMPPPQSSGPFSSPSSASGPFMSQPPGGGPPSSASFPPSIPNPPIQSSSSYPPFSSATSPPSSSAQVQSQPYPSFPSNAPPSRPPFPQSSSQQYTPPMSQPQFPPSSASSSLSSPPGPFNSPPAYAQSPQYMSGPQPPPSLHPIAPPGSSMPPRPPMPSQYPPRPSFPPANQPGNWAQANGIPSQLQAESITRQPVPSGVPMYQQGSQQMPPGMQQPSGMGGSMQQMPMNDTSQLSKRYSQPQAGYQQQQQQQYQPGGSIGNTGSVDRMSSQFRGLSVTRDGFNKLWGADCYDLLQTRNILPPDKVEPPKIQLHQEYLDGVNCRPDIFRCTLTKIPETNSLLQKSRLPLGILIHPFKDVNNLPVVQCNIIVRCRACRTYINPFVYFVDNRRWKCNLCFRVNEMPEEFQFDPVTKTYGDPSRRPEIRSSTIEYIAPSEYMLRPPQAAVYLFLLDVSCGAVEIGYLNSVCDVLFEELSQLPGDSRTQIGFIAYDSALHFFALADGLSQPQHLVVSDTTEVFLPRPDNLLVNLQECKELVQDLLSQLPTLFLNSHDSGSALGPALQAAYKLMAPTGGRVTVFQTCLPSVGVGALKPRGNELSNKEAPTQHLNPATDFYKRLALDCSGQQVAVDLFILGNKYTDLATLSGVSQFSGGCIHHLPSFDGRSNFETSVLERSFHRYLSRKIGFEAVMRIRCSRGLSIHTFHGHFFVRSTDLLSLPNVNPDAGYGMQVAIDESLADLQNVCFQAALLYTSSKGERRIRVHTLCLPLAANVGDVVCAADQQCIVGLLAKMAVDRSHQSSPADARDAFINVATDVLSTYRVLQTAGPSSGLLSPHSLRLLPLYILALLKHVAFRARQGSLDERVFAMCQMKCLPLSMLMQEIYPDLYPIHSLNEQPSYKNVDGQIIPCPPRLHLSAEKLDSRGVFLLDRGDKIIIYVGRLVSPQFCQEAFGVPQFAAIQDDVYELSALENPVSELLHNFIRQLQSEKPYEATLQIVREDSRHRMLFIEKLVEDRSESALSYYEFLQHLKAQVK
ncbi:protein transport protein Sec24A [Ischnura elegans]|uniref:protein transport protein Sec24A n=1 Tax=Ischnura elegans TaxID=197161 RepID=UPI001ED8BF21|nr:protein transport protein Sec24A [Ischnura elegans]XP_046392863.1 protein transport protein Sec24A [Ischnura elegans]